MKNFVVTKQTPPQTGNISDVLSSEDAQSADSNQSSFANTSFSIEAPILTTDAENMETNRVVDEPKSLDICLLAPRSTNDSQVMNDSEVVSQHMSSKCEDDTSSDTTNSERDDTEDSDCNINKTDDDNIVQHEHIDINRPPIITKSIAVVRFINSQELSSVDKQRAQYPNIK
ncbi:unnamed protein product [Rotaria sp. Silwood2]|nr:unnamed protein product [Rotaria sp. Silwood2]CAF3165276.1 unnamed protein product [Rotaria sp. Silwood2]CAF3525306.1 unnamed protein product [Rotaria sp. Silwood2]CAF4310393.1 unnamed protein product [Rotaria sp. Silwood2]CAF4315680.1 unnamed protein product [Rotaria sp. Silwood2]